MVGCVKSLAALIRRDYVCGLLLTDALILASRVFWCIHGDQPRSRPSVGSYRFARMCGDAWATAPHPCIGVVIPPIDPPIYRFPVTDHWVEEEWGAAEYSTDFSGAGNTVART